MKSMKSQPIKTRSGRTVKLTAKMEQYLNQSLDQMKKTLEEELEKTEAMISHYEEKLKTETVLKKSLVPAPQKAHTRHTRTSPRESETHPRTPLGESETHTHTSPRESETHPRTSARELETHGRTPPRELKEAYPRTPPRESKEARPHTLAREPEAHPRAPPWEPQHNRQPVSKLNPEAKEFIGYFPTPLHHSTPEKETNQGAIEQLVSLLSKRDHLPRMEPDIYSGDILKFYTWMTSFEALVEVHASTEQEKLFYLSKYTSRDAKRLVEGFCHYKDQKCTRKQKWHSNDDLENLSMWQIHLSTTWQTG